MLGRIHFSVKYINQKLDIKIIECKGLKDADYIGKSDPYVRLFVLPGKHPELKTKVINNNLNPVWDAMFSFTLTPSQMISKVAIFQVMDSDIGKDEPLGEARFPLAEMNLDMTSETEHWVDLIKVESVPPVVRSRMSVASSVVSRETSVSKKVSNMSFSGGHRTEHSYSTHSSHSGHSGHSDHHVSTNLRELNSRLESVVSQNRKFEDVDTKLIINLLSKKVRDNVNSKVILTKIDTNLQPLRDEYNSLAMLNAEIDILKRENEIMQTRCDELEEKIGERNEKERELLNSQRDLEGKHLKLQRERETMEARRKSYEIQLTEAKGQLKPVLEQLRLMKLDHGKWEGELMLITEKFNLCGTERDRMWSSYSEQIEREIECPSIYWEVIKEYSRRMDDEIKNLRELYVSYNAEIKGFEGREIARLNATLNESGNSGYGDVSGVLSELEIVKKRMLELEMDRLSFRQKIFEVRFALDQEEALFMAQFGAKEGALVFLKAEYEAMKQKFFSKMARVEESELHRYSSLIGEEEDIVRRKSGKYTSSDRSVVMGLRLTPQVSTKDGEVVGWNIEEHTETVH